MFTYQLGSGPHVVCSVAGCASIIPGKSPDVCALHVAGTPPRLWREVLLVTEGEQPAAEHGEAFCSLVQELSIWSAAFKGN